MEQERSYLKKTVDFITGRLKEAELELKSKHGQMVADRREMLETSNNAYFSGMTFWEIWLENYQFYNEIDSKAARYADILADAKKYLRMLELPYFARIDFTETADYPHSDYVYDTESIYIGFNNLMDDHTLFVYVYDWRSPVAGLYYNHELGRASYISPGGEVCGEITLKRQYKIKNGELLYYIDSSISIDDEILREALSRNASAQMRNIVETIQKEQNKIIRDMDNDLLMVQGVAGSGKTSIALHRIAFLLYNWRNAGNKLTAANIMIISPNGIFSRYISQVLPELGEENVGQTTFDELSAHILSSNERAVLPPGGIQTRAMFLEDLIRGEIGAAASCLNFKCSDEYRLILDELINYYIKNEIPFEDVWFDGMIVAQKNRIKTEILNDKLNIPIAKKLLRLELKLQAAITDMKKTKYDKIVKSIINGGRKVFEENSYAKKMMAREESAYNERLKKFTRIDAVSVYRLLFQKRGLLEKMAGKIKIDLPQCIRGNSRTTTYGMPDQVIPYEDAAGIVYLALKLHGIKDFDLVKHVAIDEAQDYYPLHYSIFNMLFGSGARYTVLGDYNQSLEKQADISLYDQIQNDVSHKKSILLSLNKSYRSSVEINKLSNSLLNDSTGFISYERSERAPGLISVVNVEEAVLYVKDTVIRFQGEGFDSIAVICKTLKEANDLAKKLKKLKMNITGANGEDSRGAVTVTPAYMAKGLEFDAVIVFNTSKENFHTDMDKRLLYAACTRALHRLELCAAGEMTPFFSI